MLEELHIRNVGVLDDVTLPLGPGFTVVTGETGAGKTMIVTALELLLGGRADATRIRAGASAALVEGRFAPPPAASAAWVAAGDEDLVCVREVARSDAGARSRARIAGRLASVSNLSEVLDGVVEVHGQAEAFRLADPSVQRALLDRAGGQAVVDAAATYRDAWQAWRSADADLADLDRSERDRAAELERLSAELAEIDEVAPELGEEERLATDLRRLEHAESLVDAARAASSALVDEGGARDGVGAAVAALRSVSGVDPALDALLARLEGVAAEVQDAGIELAGSAEGLDLDPEQLEALRARDAAVRRLLRSYGAGTAEVLAHAEQARARRDRLVGGQQRREALADDVHRLRAEVEEAAEALRAARTRAGGDLAQRVEGHLSELAMADARLLVELTPVEPGVTGADRVRLLLAASRGQTPLPLGRTASGGERSRIALALRLALATADGRADGVDGSASDSADEGTVMVFDEVDAGVGGAVALAVGERLARLAADRQVLCVTHQAQLAVFADHHVVVGKETTRDRDGSSRTVARARALADDEVPGELARLLAGRPDSASATSAADDLRAEARRRLARSRGAPVDGQLTGDAASRTGPSDRSGARR